MRNPRNFLAACFLLVSCLMNSQIGSLLKKAELSIDRGNLKDAIQYYNEALAKDANNRGANLGLGLLYSELLDNYGAALPYLEAASASFVNDSSYDLIFALAKCYHYNGDYDLALSYYARLHGVQDLENETNFEKETAKRKQDCEYAKARKNVRPDSNIYLVNAGKSINTEMPEYVPVLTGNNELLFTSKRQDDKKEELNYMDGKYYESMYLATIQPNGFSGVRRYTLPDKLINSKLYQHHQAVVSISQDGKKLFTFKDSKLYEINLDETSSEDPKEVKIKKFDHYKNHAFLTSDGKTLYFTGDVPGGLGGTDIYSATKTEDGQWAQPVNLGAPINTAFDEDAPYLAPDGTLYFASEGHEGFGNYDIYKSHYINNSWTPPENLGKPFNSPGHDIFLVMDSAASTGYFSSGRNGGYGDMDIYKVVYLDKIKKDCAPFDSRALWLSIEDKDTSDFKNTVTINHSARYKVLSANWKIDGNMQTENASTLDHDYFKKGSYMVYAKTLAWCDTCLTPVFACLQVENKIEKIAPTVAVAAAVTAGSSKERTNTDDENRQNEIISATNNSDLKDGKKQKTKFDDNAAVGLTDQELTALGIKKEAPLFAFNKSELSASVRAFLDENIAILKQHPELGVRLVGYADARGTAAVNKRISLRRAKSVSHYMQGHGLSPVQMVKVTGEGASHFLNHCGVGVKCDETEHSVNRRVELIIVRNK